MKARIIITPDGKIAAFIDEGSFAEGKAKLETLLADLGGLGIELTDIGEVEQHKHDTDHAHMHILGEAHNH